MKNVLNKIFMGRYKKQNELLSRELDILSSMIIKIRMGMNIDDMLDEVIQTIRDNIRFDGCNFAFIEDGFYLKIHRIDYSRVSPRSNLSREFLDNVYSQRTDYRTGNDLTSIAFRERREIHIPSVNPEEYPDELKNFFTGYGITGLYYVPVMIGEKPAAVMRFHNYSEPMYLSDFEKKLIRLRGTIIARAIENVNLYNEIKKKNETIALDLELARNIQINLLPKNYPPVAGISIAADYIPMTEVGGDFYDFITLPGRNAFGMLMADATGHGVSAAFVTTMLKTAFTGREILANCQHPSEVLSLLNNHMSDRLADNFISACYAWFDLDSHYVRIASAGHNPIFRLSRSTGTVKEIKPGGKIIGALINQKYTTEEYSIAPGDRFIFYTDGLIEEPDRNLAPFEPVFTRLITQYKEYSSEHFLETVVSKLREHSLDNFKTAFDDDVTVVIIDVI